MIGLRRRYDTMKNLVDAYTNTQTGTKKVATGGVGGGIAVVITWAISNFTEVVLPVEVATSIGALVTYLVGYITPARK